MNRTTLILAGVIAALVVLILLFGPAACQKYRSLSSQSKVDRSQAEAASNSSRDAIATQGAATTRETTSEQLTQSNEKEIHNAPGASDQVNPAVRDAGIRSLCRRAAYRDDKRCRMLATPSR